MEEGGGGEGGGFSHGPVVGFGPGSWALQHAVTRRVVCAEMPAVGLAGAAIGVAQQPGCGYSCGSCAAAPDVVAGKDGFGFCGGRVLRKELGVNV